MPQRVSLLSHVPALVLALAVVADLGQFTDPDLWGHIHFGQAVLGQHHLVWRDSYSYSAFGKLWHNHEWLSELLMALLYDRLGVVGLKIWKAACSAATVLFLSAGLAETGASVMVQLGTLAIAASALMVQIQFRPQIFTFLLFAAQMAILARYNYRGTGQLWLIVPMMTLWANLHGGFIIGIAALGVYTIVVAAQDLIACKGLKRTVRFGLLTAAAALASMMTPSGIDTWNPVIHALRNPTTPIAIADWQPLIRVITGQWRQHHLGVPYLYAVGLMAAFVVTFAVTPAGGDLPLAAIAVMMNVAAFLAVRNIALSVIACTLPVARHSALLCARRHQGAGGAFVQAENMSEHFAMKQWIALAVAAVGVAYAGLLSPRLGTDMAYPGGAVAFMKQHNLRGNVLTDFAWGEYLIWHLGPASKVFIDGRYDTVFSDKIIDDYIDFHSGLPQARAVLRSYPHDFVLIAPGTKAYGLMKTVGDWKVVYRDKYSALFARTVSSDAKIPGAPVLGAAPPACFP